MYKSLHSFGEGRTEQCAETDIDLAKDTAQFARTETQPANGGQHGAQEQQKADIQKRRGIDGDRGCRWQTGEGDLEQTVWLASSLALITAGLSN